MMKENNFIKNNNGYNENKSYSQRYLEEKEIADKFYKATRERAEEEEKKKNSDTKEEKKKNEKILPNGNVDDGSLACLGLNKSEMRPDKKLIDYTEISQSLLCDNNFEFWIQDYEDGIHTRYGDNKMSILVSPEKDSPDSDCYKVITGSSSVMNTVRYLKENNLLPRRAHFVKNQNSGGFSLA